MDWESMFVNLTTSHFGLPRNLKIAMDRRSYLKGWFRVKRTHVCNTEALDEFYSPRFPVSEKYKPYFKPTKLTNSEGQLVNALQKDFQQ